jgi:hypothetical protein
MALPGRKKENEIKQKPGKPAAAAEGSDAAAEEFSFEQMKEMGKELKNLKEEDAQKQLAEIKAQKAAELEAEKAGIKQEKKKVEKVDLKDITTELEAKKGGLPEHIAKLPEKHPIRVRWEKGFRQREDGTWFKLSDDEIHSSISISDEKQHAFLLLPLIVVGLLVIIGGNWYASQLTETREDIIKTVKFKGLKNNPEAKKQLKRAYESQWLPELSGILNTFKKSKRSFSGFSDNKEGGSYIKHIKKHNKKFDPEEAMRWRTKTIRKPSD